MTVCASAHVLLTFFLDSYRQLKQYSYDLIAQKRDFPTYLLPPDMAGQGEGRVRRQSASTFNGAVAMARPTSMSTPVKTTIEVLQPEQGKIGGSLA